MCDVAVRLAKLLPLHCETKRLGADSPPGPHGHQLRPRVRLPLRLCAICIYENISLPKRRDSDEPDQPSGGTTANQRVCLLFCCFILF